ncbi:hypothetical protein [Mycolicibacterium palauense]|uniref:hypothetical protein n=1 Tax=Mycolicibacterium palauense TaxID=2034511 RepID=UPI000BFEB794|nr:hypothetical protein [Mycolicibacterium palauense]
MLAAGGAAATVLTTGLTTVLTPAPAYADPPLLNGTYSGNDSEFVWTVSSSCAPSGCTANVASNQGWTSVATYAGGTYNFTVTKPDGVICEDGSYAPAYISLSVDPVTLAGTISSDSNYGCPGGDISRTPFQLKKIG